jgi:hypothetical protein
VVRRAPGNTRSEREREAVRFTEPPRLQVSLRNSLALMSAATASVKVCVRVCPSVCLAVCRFSVCQGCPLARVFDCHATNRPFPFRRSVRAWYQYLYTADQAESTDLRDLKPKRFFQLVRVLLVGKGVHIRFEKMSLRHLACWTRQYS